MVFIVRVERLVSSRWIWVCIIPKTMEHVEISIGGLNGFIPSYFSHCSAPLLNVVPLLWNCETKLCIRSVSFTKPNFLQSVTLGNCESKLVIGNEEESRWAKVTLKGRKVERSRESLPKEATSYSNIKKVGYTAIVTNIHSNIKGSGPYYNSWIPFQALLNHVERHVIMGVSALVILTGWTLSVNILIQWPTAWVEDAMQVHTPS